MEPTICILDLFSSVLSAWVATEGRDEMEVIPVLVEGVAKYRSLIEAILWPVRGVFLDAQESVSGANGIADPALSAVVTNSLGVRRAGGRNLDVQIRQAGANVHAVIDGKDATTSSAGLLPIFGVAASLFDKRLQDHSLAVLTYREAPLDADLADAAWRLFTEQLAVMRVGALRVLLVLVDTPNVNHDRHCTAGVSLRFRLDQSGLARRKDWGVSSTLIRQLRPGDDRPLVMFLGAGFSVSSGLPLGNDLRDDALRIHIAPNAPDTLRGLPYAELANRFRRFIEEHGRQHPSERRLAPAEFAERLTLERVLREEFHVYKPQDRPTLRLMATKNEEALRRPGPAVWKLRKLLEHQRGVVIVTVNFDTLIEDGCPHLVRVFASDGDFEVCPNYIREYLSMGGQVPVLKLHGTITQPDTIVATDDLMAGGLAGPKAASLRALLPTDDRIRLVYLGYSMRDPDVANVLALPEFQKGLDECWVSPFVVKTTEQFAERSRRFESQRSFWQRCITETGDVFFTELAKSW